MRMVHLELSERFAGLRQGMKVVDSTGTAVGQVRDVSRQSLLVMEAGGTRVFWIEGDAVTAVDGQVVRLRKQFGAVSQPGASGAPLPA